ncbi:MAG: outer membrane protein assembly factor BamD [Bacteroidaceae bacterium]|nr:outer membrane protein assembly factor BamD [Bacteroidaceae bacterium]
MKRHLFIISCSLLLLITSCSDYTKVQKTTDYLYKYETAKQYYAEGQYNRASLLLQDIVSMLKGTDKGEESLYLMAMANFKARNYDAASSYFKKYYQSYPRGIFAEEAYYHCGKSLYMDTPEPKLDQTDTYEAVTEFQNFLELYPTSRFREDAQNKIFDLQDKLVEKEYLSAKLYYNLGSYFGNCTSGGSNYQACIVTAENAIKDYPYTSRREDFAILILKAKFELAEQSIELKKEERYHNAIDEYYSFVNEFPESAFLKEATSLFEKAKKHVRVDENSSDYLK